MVHLALALVFLGLAVGTLYGCMAHWQAGSRPEACIDGAFTVLMGSASALALSQVL